MCVLYIILSSFHSRTKLNKEKKINLILSRKDAQMIISREL